jgi:hypothetical protein
MEQQNKYSVHNEVVILQGVYRRPQDASSTLSAPTMEQQSKYSVHNEVVLLQGVHHRPQDAFLRPSRLLRWNN